MRSDGALLRPQSQGKNWSVDRSTGTYYNGHGSAIRDPGTYFSAVGENRHGYNSSYSNGHGKTIENPSGYYKAVGEDRYGYNGTRSSGR
eukprot:tig00020610_g11969.t1